MLAGSPRLAGQCENRSHFRRLPLDEESGVSQGEGSAKIHFLPLPLSLLPAASFTARTSWVLHGVGGGG